MSYQRDTESPDERRRRLRRSRLTLLVAAAIAAAVIVPLGINVRQSWVAAGGPPGSADATSTAASSPTPHDETPLVDPEQPWLYELAAEATALAEALDAGGEKRTLTAPAAAIPCPTDTGAMSEALGVPLDYAGGSISDYSDQCTWSSGPSEGPTADRFAVGIGFYAGWSGADLEGLGGDEDCWRTPVDGFEPTAVLEACLLEGDSSSWTLFVVDSGGTGVWTLFATEGEAQPVQAPAALDAVVEVATATW